jgi:hypothetical protein
MTRTRSPAVPVAADLGGIAAAVVRAVLALGTAVLTSYVGKQVMYGVEYPGMPCALEQLLVTGSFRG